MASRTEGRAATTRAVQHAVTIMRMLGESESLLPLREISAAISLPKSTTYRVLSALVTEGLVYQDEQTGDYGLSAGVVRLASPLMRKRGLADLCRDQLRELQRATGESVGLHLLVASNRVCIEEIESSHALRMISGVGSVFPLHAGAAGKAILAFNDSAQRACREMVLEALTPSTVTSWSTIEEELASIRETGYATSYEETTPGASAVACAILDERGQAVAAINVAGPLERWTRDRIGDHVSLIGGAVASLSAALAGGANQAGDAAR